eukprot:CAMPEP_0182862752 /NCGR_PEP_ID=MMETSP0034_2-20130328/6249_1 /TAXON_ID=156128 /ORGANISM="Nephroselmis pyriformis, Strain CCMP717" /LENGTH=217 /DNA_ID=CAMNT_0024994867 /DNA_START=24 /DNA_END=677 /DNA_ORIENTATION=+
MGLGLAVLVAMALAFAGPQGCHANAAAAKKSAVKVLTEDNFSEMVEEGVWLVEVYAPWCTHCKQLEPTWEALAEKLEGQVHVAKLDGTTEQSIMQQLMVPGFPTIYLMIDGKTYEYPATGARGVAQLSAFALEGYKKSTPVPFYRAPNSFVGKHMGKFMRMPRLVIKYYHHLHKDQGYSELVLLLGALAVPVMLGLLLICIMDTCITLERGMHAHQH